MFLEQRLLLVVVLVAGAAGISFRVEPSAQTVVQGQSTTLRCQVDNQDGVAVFWQNVVTGEYISRDRRIDPYNRISDSTKRRYRIIGDHGSGEYNLQIRRISMRDDSSYACVYFQAIAYYSKVVRLRVLKPPDRGYPLCLLGPSLQMSVGDNITLVCESKGGDPPATLTWIRGESIMDATSIRHEYRTVSGYQHTLTPDDRDKRFTCVARNQALAQPRSCYVIPLRSSIEVLLRPVVSTIYIGDNMSFNCISENIPYLIYRWSVNGQAITGSSSKYDLLRSGSRLRIINATLEDDASLVTCSVEQESLQLSAHAVGQLWVRQHKDNALERTATLTTVPVTTTPIVTTTKPSLTTQQKTELITTQPVTTTETVTTTEPITTTKPITTTEQVTTTPTTPAPTTKPVTTTEPATTTKPITTTEPLTTTEPITTTEKITTTETITTTEVITTTEPIATTKLVTTTDPVTTTRLLTTKTTTVSTTEAPTTKYITTTEPVTTTKTLTTTKPETTTVKQTTQETITPQPPPVTGPNSVGNEPTPFDNSLTDTEQLNIVPGMPGTKKPKGVDVPTDNNLSGLLERAVSRLNPSIPEQRNSPPPQPKSTPAKATRRVTPPPTPAILVKTGPRGDIPYFNELPTVPARPTTPATTTVRPPKRRKGRRRTSQPKPGTTTVKTTTTTSTTSPPPTTLPVQHMTVKSNPTLASVDNAGSNAGVAAGLSVTFILLIILGVGVAVYYFKLRKQRAK